MSARARVRVRARAGAGAGAGAGVQAGGKAWVLCRSLAWGLAHRDRERILDVGLAAAVHAAEEQPEQVLHLVVEVGAHPRVGLARAARLRFLEAKEVAQAQRDWMEHVAHGSRDSRWTPPDQYGLVESQVYRSAFLTPASFDFINLLNLRTVVNLSQEVPVRAVLSFFQENNITLENVGLQVC